MRRVRSFVRRSGRMTDAQRDALKTLFPRFQLSLEDGLLDFKKNFHREAPHILEIGFGSGYSLLEIAKCHPEKDFIGIEMHQPGIGTLLLNMDLEKIHNIRIYYADAVEVLTQCIPENSLDVVQIFFPDPWPKRRHHKRRLIQSEFVKLLISKIKINGMLHLATDWEDYAREMMTVISDFSELRNVSGEKQYAHRSDQRPVITKFEKRGQHAGREIWELQFIKNEK